MSSTQDFDPGVEGLIDQIHTYSSTKGSVTLWRAVHNLPQPVNLDGAGRFCVSAWLRAGRQKDQPFIGLQEMREHYYMAVPPNPPSRLVSSSLSPIIASMGYGDWLFEIQVPATHFNKLVDMTGINPAQLEIAFLWCVPRRYIVRVHQWGGSLPGSAVVWQRP